MYIELLDSSKIDTKSIKKFVIINVVSLLIIYALYLLQFYKYDISYFYGQDDGELKHDYVGLSFSDKILEYVFG